MYYVYQQKRLVRFVSCLLSFVDHSFHHGMDFAAISADMEPMGLTQMANQFLFRSQTGCDEQRFAGENSAIGGFHRFQLFLTQHFGDGGAAEKGNGEICQATLIFCHAAAGIPLLHQRYGDITFRQMLGHDETKVTAS